MRTVPRMAVMSSIGCLLLAAGSLLAQAPTPGAASKPASAAAAPPKSGASAKPATSSTAAKPAASTAAPATPPTEGAFTKEQLEQLVAPIALYPDGLLTQTFMAATYPLQIVEAARFIEKNPDLKGDALNEKLKEQDWDEAVKSICTFPEVLKKMNDNLDWTQDLGDAMLGQQTELLDAVQVMRGKAYDSGNLKDNEQQTVKVEQPPAEEKIIVIESKDPEVIYVPQYSPTVVYAGWGYPSYYYPGMYPYYPPGYGFMSFTAGVIVGGAIWGNCNWGWGHSDVDIDINRNNNFNRNTNINGGNRVNPNNAGGKQSWQHNAQNRKGVNYRDGATASKYGASAGSNRVSSQEARGRSGSGASAGTRQAGATAGTRQGGAGAGAGTRPSTGAGAGAGSRQSASASSSSRSGSSSSRPSSSTYGGSSPSRSSSAYSGSRSPSGDRAASSRGSASRGGSYGGGGMSRGGGGGRGGGGRRR